MQKSKLAIEVLRLLEEGVITDVQADRLAKMLKKNQLKEVENAIRKINKKPQV